MVRKLQYFELALYVLLLHLYVNSTHDLLVIIAWITPTGCETEITFPHVSMLNKMRVCIYIHHYLSATVCLCGVLFGEVLFGVLHVCVGEVCCVVCSFIQPADSHVLSLFSLSFSLNHTQSHSITGCSEHDMYPAHRLAPREHCGAAHHGGQGVSQSVSESVSQSGSQAVS
jgi:hypothetical protein